MRIRRIMILNNWKDALQEVLLIVIGVTLALAATSWYEGHQKRITEQELLSQIKIDLQEKQSFIENNLELHLQLAVDIQKVIDFIDSDKEDPTGYGFRLVGRFYGFQLNTSIYEVLKSQGLDSISDLGVRSSIVSFYEQAYPSIYSVYMNDRETSISQVGPFLNEYFIADQNENWLPKDLEFIREENVFKNMCIRRLGRINRFTIPSHQNALDEIDELLKTI